MNVIFMGTPAWAIPSLQSLIDFFPQPLKAVYTQPDRPVGRKRILQASPIKEFAESHQLPIYTPEKAGAPEALEEIKAMEPDLIIVCAYGQILPQAFLDIPRIGCFNLHFSLLPKWRGASPVQAAIKAGDAYTGVALQKMVLKLDAGPLVASSAQETILPTDTSPSLGERLSYVGAQLITEVLPSLTQQSFTLTPQAEAEATFCRIIKKQEGQIDWQSEDAQAIERKLRAFTPWPGIYTLDEHGKRLQLTEVECLPSKDLPLAVMQSDGCIGTQNGTLRVLKLKPEGKQEMMTEAFFCGYAGEAVVLK